MDSLHTMLADQAEAQKTIGNDHTAMTPDQWADHMRTMAFSVCDEVHEAMAEVGWKPWATSRHINSEEFMGEMTDAWLFFMNMMIAGGMTAEDLIARTAKKQNNLLNRIASGYDGRTTKCGRCKRAYDNEGVKCRPGKFGELGQCAYVSNSPDLSLTSFVICSSCTTPLDDAHPLATCRPASAYQGTAGYCDRNGYLPAIQLPDWSTHCMACCASLDRFGCVNPSKQGMGWCARYKSAHSDNHGLMHTSHKRGSGA